MTFSADPRIKKAVAAQFNANTAQLAQFQPPPSSNPVVTQSAPIRDPRLVRKSAVAQALGGAGTKSNPMLAGGGPDADDDLIALQLSLVGQQEQMAQTGGWMPQFKDAGELVVPPVIDAPSDPRIAKKHRNHVTQQHKESRWT